MLEGVGMPEPAGKTLTEDQVLLIAKAVGDRRRYEILKRLGERPDALASHIRGRLRGAPADHRKGLAHLRGSRDSRAHGDTESEICRFPADHAKPDRSGALFGASRIRAA